MKIPNSYILTNKVGSFYLWSNEPYSKFCGLFFKINEDFVKCIETIEINSPIKNTKNIQHSIINKRDSLIETISLNKNKNIITYDLSKKTDITLTLDVHKANDFDDFERDYSLKTEQDCIIIEYTKKKIKSNKEYEYYIAIKSDNLNYKEIKEFVKREYSYDKFRNSNCERYVFKCLSLNASIFTLSMSDNKDNAIKNALEEYKLKRSSKKILESKTNYDKLINATSKIKKIYSECCYNMDKLITNNGIYAGLPWFFQEWTRDELISLKYIMLKSEYDKVKDILFKYYNINMTDGRLPAILPNQGNKSADSIGWLAFRTLEFIEILKNNKLHEKYFNNVEINKIKDFFINVAEFHVNNYFKNELIYSEKDETWMDTTYKDDARDGFCIEIQTLCLRIFEIAYILSNDEKFNNYKNKLIENIKSKFLVNGNLIDRLELNMKPDNRIRPNIFIAYYTYPELLSKKEWENTFDKTLEKTWLEWGGIASIAIDDELFLEEHTGENNKSYHRGDSWYYINCIAAISMYKLNNKKYNDKINKIINACCKEVMNNGVIGALAEVSSAKQLSGYGCLSQAWSNTLFIELIKLIYG
jgi:glycogen debranching enzyme